MSRPPAPREMNERHVLVLRAVRDRRPVTDLPRRWPFHGPAAQAPLTARGVRAIRDDAIDRLARAVLANSAPYGLPVDLWPPPDVRDQAVNLGDLTDGRRARRQLLKDWLTGPPEPADAIGLDDRELLSLRALHEGWPAGQIAQRMPRRDRPGEFGIGSTAASMIRTRALDRLVSAILVDRLPPGLPADLWPPETVRERVRTAAKPSPGYDPCRELLRRWFEEPTLSSQGPGARRKGIRRGRLHAVRNPAELERPSEP